MHRRPTPRQACDLSPVTRYVEVITSEEINNRNNEIAERAQLVAVIITSALIVTFVSIALTLHYFFNVN
ncbi:hypothetical protein CRV006 [Nile crocodilepox virus]|uniref:Uncharacterized protein n=1 Tax=Nile crocodilepox virus (isolate Crocodylus niloticus/Zimbabwe/Ume/2001) TaxID=1289473 RepID=Q06ZX4_CPRVZ|nr:hypothetical protein CRV006 [Nile crocodilepox virus]ABJ08897.1 hypothetical protein CRV006 [Nile crocodilepox virus]